VELFKIRTQQERDERKILKTQYLLLIHLIKKYYEKLALIFFLEQYLLTFQINTGSQ